MKFKITMGPYSTTRPTVELLIEDFLATFDVLKLGVGAQIVIEKIEE